MLKRLVFALVLVVGTCSSVVVAPALAAPGDLIRSFGRNGVTELPFYLSEQVYANDVAAAPGGDLYVLRTNYGYGSFGGARVERLRSDGSPNPAFGGDGAVAVPGGSLGGGGSSSLAVAADGKVIVAVPAYLTRLNPDGSLDGSFGKAGFLRANASTSGGELGFISFAIQDDGRIVVAADRGRFAGDPVLELARYTRDGAPDPSFGGGSPIPADVETGKAGIALFGDGGLAVAGNPCCFHPGQARVLRLRGDGSPEGGFGSDGMSPINDASQPVNVTAILSQPGGKVVVMATRESGSFSTFLMRFRPDGKRDKGFGKRGVLGLGEAESRSPILVDHRGRLTIVSLRRTAPAPGGGPPRVTLRRLMPNGQVDRTFGGGQPVRLYRLLRPEPVSATLGPKGRISVLMQTGSCNRSCSPFHSYLGQWAGGSSKARCFGKRATIVGTSRRDVLRGTPHRDVIALLGGDDTVRAGRGDDLICGGPGNDHLGGGRGRDRVRQ